MVYGCEVEARGRVFGFSAFLSNLLKFERKVQRFPVYSLPPLPQPVVHLLRSVNLH